MKKATLLTVGASSGMACIERDATFVAEQHELAHKQFTNHKDYPVYDWQTEKPLTGQIVDVHQFLFAIKNMPVREVMKLDISCHGFKYKFDDGVDYCLWFGDKKNWIRFRDLIDYINVICEDNPIIKKFHIKTSTCFAGAGKQSFTNAKHKSNGVKELIDIQSKSIVPFGEVKGNPKGKINVHKKISLLACCKGNQTSYGEFVPNDFCEVTTAGKSLDVSCLISAMNWFYSYAPGLNLKIAGKTCKPRSKLAIITLAQKRVTSKLKAIALREWHEWGQATVWQKFTMKGEPIFY